MRVLLDECTPRLLKRKLKAALVRTVPEMGWDGVQNGELLRRAESSFDVLVTTDQNLRHQQNMGGRKIAIVILPTNKVTVVSSLAGEINNALAKIQSGELVQIPFPP